MDGWAKTTEALRGRARVLRAWASRRRPVLAIAAVITALAVVVPLTVVAGGEGGSTDELVTAAPTEMATADRTETAPAEPTPTAAVTSPATAAGPLPAATATATTSPEPTFSVSREAMLSDGYIEATFAEGRPARVRHSEDRAGDKRAKPSAVSGQHSCLQPLADSSAAPISHLVSTDWSWAGETVVSEHLAEAGSLSGAKQRFDLCADPSAAGFDPDARLFQQDGGQATTRRLALGDEAYLVVVHRSVETSVYAGVRRGTSLLVVTWRASGTITSPDALQRVLNDAFDRALGRAEPPPSEAAPVRRDPALQGFPTWDELPGVYGRDQAWLIWNGDLRLPGTSPFCGGELALRERPVLRFWSELFTGSESPRSVSVALAAAAEGADVEKDFEACREVFRHSDGAVTEVSGVGDRAFVTVDTFSSYSFPSGDGYARVGTWYVHVSAPWLDEEQLTVLLRAAVQGFETSGRWA